jgi:hypothetical protein
MADLSQSYENHFVCLAQMLQAFEIMFDIKEIYYSDNTVFDTLDTDPNNILYECFTKFVKKMKTNPHVELTPAYDLKAAYVAINDYHCRTTHNMVSMNQIIGKNNDKVLFCIMYCMVFTIVFKALYIIYSNY